MFRKPKPAHSVREFLGEIGTITIGILIALRFEAAVDAYRNHDLVEPRRRTSAMNSQRTETALPIRCDRRRKSSKPSIHSPHMTAGGSQAKSRRRRRA